MDVSTLILSPYLRCRTSFGARFDLEIPAYSGVNVGDSITTHYLYDESDQRVEQDVKIGSAGTTTTKYFSNLYETTGATTTLYVYAGGQLLATIEGNGSATSTYIAHTDHQGSTNVMSDKNGALAQLSTSYPFGKQRNDEHPANFDEARKFIGQYQDRATTLSYLNARYYDGGHGQFTSQDPVASDIGLMEKIPIYILMMNQDASTIDQTTLLSNPQMLNSYSYAINNPINKSDPSGKQLSLAQASPYIAIVTLLYSLATSITNPQTRGAFLEGVNSLANSIRDSISWGSSGGGGGSSPSASTVKSSASPVAPVLGGGYTAVSTPQVMPGTTIGNINLRKGPDGLPTGALPLDEAGLPKGVPERIKKGIGIERNQDTFIGPNGEIYVDQGGQAVESGNVEEYLKSPGRGQGYKH